MHEVRLFMSCDRQDDQAPTALHSVLIGNSMKTGIITAKVGLEEQAGQAKLCRAGWSLTSENGCCIRPYKRCLQPLLNSTGDRQEKHGSLCLYFELQHFAAELP